MNAASSAVPRTLVSVDYRPPDHFGRSFESALQIREALRREGVVAQFFSVNEPCIADSSCVVFPVAENYLEPESLEDPFALRRFLESQGIRFVGSSCTALCATADKLPMKSALRAGGYDVPPGVFLSEPGLVENALEEFLSRNRFPAVLKPARGLGGSTGVQWIPDRHVLDQILDCSLSSGGAWLLEEYVAGTEVTCWVTGSGSTARCESVIEIDKGGRPIYSRAAKTGSDPAQPVCAPRLSSATLEAVRGVAVGIHRLFGLRSHSRVDMIVADGRPVVLEINATPTLRNNGFGIARGACRSFGEILADLVREATCV